MHKQLIHKLHCRFLARKAHWGTPLLGMALWAGVLLLLKLGY